MLVHLLASGDFGGVTYLLSEVQTATVRGAELPPELRNRAARFPDRVSAPVALSLLLQSLDDALVLPPEQSLTALFEQLRPGALFTVFHWLGRSRSEQLRRLLERVADRLASMHTAELVRLIQVPDREVAAEAIRRAGSLRTQAAVSALNRILSESDSTRRPLAAHALAAVGSPGALQALERVIADPDREMRLIAVRAFSAARHQPAFQRIDSIIRDRSFRDSDITEKMAFFEAYAAVGGENAVPHLSAVLNGRSFLGRRSDTELRAASAIALGRIHSSASTSALQTAANDKDAVIRNAVGRALRQTPA
jgi:HEAT repeat protein